MALNRFLEKKGGVRSNRRNVAHRPSLMDNDEVGEDSRDCLGRRRVEWSLVRLIVFMNISTRKYYALSWKTATHVELRVCLGDCSSDISQTLGDDLDHGGTVRYHMVEVMTSTYATLKREVSDIERVDGSRQIARLSRDCINLVGELVPSQSEDVDDAEDNDGSGKGQVAEELHGEELECERNVG